MKDTKKTFAKLDKVNFTPDAKAMENANKQGWSVVEKVIVDGKCKLIMDERTALVENALKLIDKFDKDIAGMEPKETVTYGAQDRQKIITNAVLSEAQLKALEKAENKRNSIAKALNTVMTEFNAESFKKLKEVVDKNKS